MDMANLHIGEPDVLARLARPAAANGRLWVSVVQGFSAGTSRKRQEVCVAVDGDSVSIHEIQKGRSIASFSIPPDAVLQCAPSSIRIKLDAGRSRRQTYCILNRRNTIQIQLQQEQEDGVNKNSSIASVTLAYHESSAMEIIPLPVMDAVAVVFADGSYQLLAADLSVTLSNGALDCGLAGAHLIAITFLSLAEARKSVLRGRPDIITSTPEQSIFACGIVKTRSDIPEQHQVLLYRIWCLTNTPIGMTEPAVVFSHPLTTNTQASARDQDSAAFICKNSRLALRCSSKSVKYDLTSTVPRRISEFVCPASDHISSIEISDNMTLCSTPNAVQLYNSAFRSLQTSIDLGRHGQKRKRGNNFSGPVSLVTYFPSLQRAIGTRRNYLVAVDILLPPSASTTTKFDESSLLLHNIGKGAHNTSRHKSHGHSRQFALGVVTNHSEPTEDWTSTTKILDASLDQEDGAAFEETFLQHLEVAEQGAIRSLPVVPDYKANYVLSKIFSLDQDAEKSTLLTIRFHRAKLFSWLADKGYLTPRKVSEALRSTSANGKEGHLSYVDIVEALIAIDTSLAALQQYISNSPQFPTEDLCRTIKLIIGMALNNGQVGSGTLNDHHNNTDHMNALVRVADSASNISMAHFDTLLSTALTRLARSGGLKLAKHLQKTFQHQELIALIQFLRQKLFHAGYTRSVTSWIPLGSSLPEGEMSHDHSVRTEQRADLPLLAIATILSSCIDAIGPLGLLNSEQEDDFTERLIPELSSEIMRASEALEDAVFLQGILRETLRYTESIRGHVTNRQGQETGADAPLQKPGTIRTIYSESATDESCNGLSALPISLQAEGQVSQHKVRKGDGKLIGRSKREIGMLQDRLRGPYSLERLVL